jgi:hypothetical protein
MRQTRNEDITENCSKWKSKWRSFIFRSLTKELTIEVMHLNRIKFRAGKKRKVLTALASRIMSRTLRGVKPDYPRHDTPFSKQGKRWMITWTRLVNSPPFPAPESYTQMDAPGMRDNLG